MSTDIYSKNALTENWNVKELDILKQNYCHMKMLKLMELLGRSETAIFQKANQLGLRKTHKWTNKEVDLLKNIYSGADTETLESNFPNHTLGSINKKAKILGLERKNIKKPYWNSQEVSKLKALLMQGCKDAKIAEVLNRPIGSVREHRLEMEFKLREFWSETENELLKKNYSDAPIRNITSMFSGRSINAIRKQAAKLGLYRPKEWGEESDQLLKLKFSPSTIFELLSLLPGKTKRQIKRRARQFGLKKNLETLARCFRTDVDKIPIWPGKRSQWRNAVLVRDGFCCQECGCRPQKLFLQAHHIIPVRDANCAKYDVSNGICLCIGCHIKIHDEEYDFIAKYNMLVQEASK